MVEPARKKDPQTEQLYQDEAYGSRRKGFNLKKEK